MRIINEPAAALVYGLNRKSHDRMVAARWGAP
jgi:hypothetical protein